MAACPFYCYSKVWTGGGLAGHPEPLSDIPSRQAFRQTLPTYLSDIPLNHRSDIPSDIPFRRTLDNPLPTCLRMYMASHHYLIRANTLVFTSYRKKTQSVMWVPRPAFCIKPAGGETHSPRVRHTSDIPPTYPGPHCRSTTELHKGLIERR